MKNSDSGFGLVHILIHWVAAITVLFLFVIGLWMEGLDYYHEWYHTAPLIHQSVGILLVALMLFRLFWRQYAGMPAPLKTHKTWEKILAKVVHGFLYLLVISMLFTGYIIVTSDGQPLSFFGLPIPALITEQQALHEFSKSAHKLVAFIIVGLAVSHGAAAFKHHFIDRDDTLKRIIRPVK